MISTLLDFMALHRVREFVECLEMVSDELSEKERQRLLFEIINRYYDHDHYEELVSVFDTIQKVPVNLNFNVKHRAASFLSLVICRAPHLKLLHYFIKKGACINFVGDRLAFVPKKDLEFAKLHLEDSRYQTCLDFAESELNSLISKNLSFVAASPKLRIHIEGSPEVTNKLLINADEYEQLHHQNLYLKKIILTKRIIDYLKCMGARTYSSFST